jgi:hypothetical protein
VGHGRVPRGNAAAHRDRRAVLPELIQHVESDALGEGSRATPARSGQESDELVAAEAADHVPPSPLQFEHLPDDVEDKVTVEATVAAVVPLETIDVDLDDRASPLPPALRELRRERGLEGAPVWKSGDLIPARTPAAPPSAAGRGDLR